MVADEEKQRDDMRRREAKNEVIRSFILRMRSGRIYVGVLGVHGCVVYIGKFWGGADGIN